MSQVNSTRMHVDSHSITKKSVTLKRKLGCWFYERWKAELIMRAPSVAHLLGMSWLDLCNRHERISVDPVTGGRVCDWPDSSPLTFSRLFPEAGARFLKSCLQQWPVRFVESRQPPVGQPEISFVIGVRGTKRLPQFQATVASLLGQSACEVEVIVVEQSREPEFSKIVPAGVTYLHTLSTHPDMPFNRSWALNVGARQAKGRIVVLHDGDYFVPAYFAREISRVFTNGVESARLPRYIFYLDEASSGLIQETRSFDQVRAVNKVNQNNPTPVALTREAYLRIGGHDEAFYGWGGEDNEFLNRARTLKHSEGAFLPVIHLWHPEAPNRSGDRNADFLQSIMAEAAQARIKKLSTRNFGQSSPSIRWERD